MLYEKKLRLRKKFKVFFLIYFVCFTFCLSCITFSKYTGVISRSGPTSVAKWDVSIDTTDNASDTLTVVTDSTAASYIVKVVNKSEVSSDYSIVLSNVPTGLEVSLDSGVSKTPINNEIVFSNAGSFVASDATNTHRHVLTFNDPNGNSNEGTHNIRIDINLEQTH